MQRMPDLREVRIYGLNISKALTEYLGKGDIVRLRGILLHPQTDGTFQWAQVWVSTEVEVGHLLSLREALAVNGITISQVGSTAVTPPHSTWDIISQLSKPRVAPSGFGLTAVNNSSFARPGANSALPRNLYILNLPLDLTQIEFKSLFTPYGMVEHSILLSQLDGIGRRRGFVLMSSHREATEAMRQMHGKWIDGSKLDVSWALVQRESKSTSSTMPNRVVHPPTTPARRELPADCSVIVEDLDPLLFPDADTVSAIFRSFGPIDRTLKLSDTSVLVQFESARSAAALISANGLKLGERTLKSKPLYSRPSSAPIASKPHTQTPIHQLDDAFKNFHVSRNEPQTPVTPQSFSSGSSRLNADSRPFIPGSKSKSAVDLLSPPIYRSSDHLSNSFHGESQSSASGRVSEKTPFFATRRASPADTVHEAPLK